MTTSPGAELARLLLAGFTGLVDEVVIELGRHGHPAVTATHEFALQAIDAGAQSASELGRRLGVTKQAAAKTISALEALGYVDRRIDPQDARRKHLTVTSRGHEMMDIGAGVFDALRNRLADQVGTSELHSFENVLAALTAGRGADRKTFDSSPDNATPRLHGPAI